jgi:hypothetical protein
MGRKVRFSALHRTAPRLARDFSDSFKGEVRGIHLLGTSVHNPSSTSSVRLAQAFGRVYGPLIGE